MKIETVKVTLLIISLLLLSACSNSSPIKNKSEELIFLPQGGSIEKRDIVLDDIADVTYIPLELNDNCLMSYPKMLSMSDNEMVIEDREGGHNCYFWMDGLGNWVKTLVKAGQGPEEYGSISYSIYDNNKKELSLFEYGNPSCKVYNNNGDFVRKHDFDFPYDIGNSIFFYNNNLYAYKSSNLPFYKNNSDEDLSVLLETTNIEWLDNSYSYFKLDSDNKEVLDSVAIPKKYHFKYYAVVSVVSGTTTIFGIRYIPFFNDGTDLILSDIVADTVYSVGDNMKLTPWAVKDQLSEFDQQKPVINISSIFPKYIFYSSFKFSDELKHKEYQKNYLYNRQTGDVCMPNLSLREYGNVEFSQILNTNNDNNVIVFFLSYDELSKAMEKGELSGKLLELAQNMTEDDNPILVKIRFK